MHKNQQQAEADLGAVYEASAKDKAALNQRTLDQIELTRQLGDLQADRLGIIGKTSQAERLRLENQIKYLEALKQREEAEGKDTSLRAAQIQNEQEKLKQLGVVTINVGQTIATSLGDAFEGVILGTRKLADVGKGLMAALLRDIGQFFTQAIIKKLGFENIVLSNANSFIPQLAGVFGSNGPNGGGIVQQGNTFFGNAGGLAGGLANTFPSMFGFGSAPQGVAGPLMANGGFFSQAAGAGAGGGGGGGAGGLVGTAFSAISTAWSALSSTTLGATITSAIASIASTISTTISATLSTVTGWLASIPVVGWIAAAVVAIVSGIYRIIANQQERPNAKFSGQFEGVSFDETMSQFIPGEINVAIGRKSGIKNSQAGRIAENLQARLKVLADQWVGILNIFPDFIADDIQPALEETNRRLNQNFANIKFSPGGSRSIQQELEAMSGPDGLVRFFQAFQPSLIHGFGSTLSRAGVSGVEFGGFDSIAPGFKFPKEDWEKFITAIKDVAGLTSQLGSIGASKFLTGSDLTGVGSLFNQLFSTSDASTFTKAADEIKEKLQPVIDFLEAAVKESTDVFGRGLQAALSAATESDANKAFLENLGAGVKEKVFGGIVESFVASAQFGDLLAPIQKIIREFTQQALETGQTPDIGAFRRAILPGIEDISTRAGTLAPLIAELQRLGLDISDSVTRLFGPEGPVAAVAAAPRANITINIAEFTGTDSDVDNLARRLDTQLRGVLAP